MKKMEKILPLALMAVVIIIAVGTVMAGAIDSKSIEEEKYAIKYAYDDKEDGWKIAFKIYLRSNGKNSYSFNGYNLKYDELDGYYIPMVDSQTGEIVEKIKPKAIMLSVSEKYSKEIIEVNRYFNEKQFISSISLSDLSDLNVEKIDKKYLVNLFNKAINSEELTEKGNYADSALFDRVEVKSTNDEMEGTWRLTYIIDYGNISDIYIDFISKDGEYLKDKKKQNKTEKDKISEIMLLEDSLIDKLNQKNINSKEKNIDYYTISKNYINSENSNVANSDIQKLIEETLKSLNN